MGLGGMTSRDRRTLALGAGAMLCIVLVGRGLPAWRAYRAAQQESIATASAAVARMRRGAHDRRALADSAGARERRAAAIDSAVIEAPTTTEASAAVLAVLAQMGESSGARIRSTQLGPIRPLRGPYAVQGARVVLTGDVAALARFLAAVEDRELLMATRQASITQPDPGAAREQPEVLQAEIDIDTLLRIARAAPMANAPAGPMGAR